MGLPSFVVTQRRELIRLEPGKQQQQQQQQWLTLDYSITLTRTIAARAKADIRTYRREINAGKNRWRNRNLL